MKLSDNHRLELAESIQKVGSFIGAFLDPIGGMDEQVLSCRMRGEDWLPNFPLKLPYTVEFSGGKSVKVYKDQDGDWCAEYYGRGNAN